MMSSSWRSLAARVLWVVAGVGTASWVVESRVVGVCDGDTITILDRDNSQHKVRLAGIDAREKGRASAMSASAMAFANERKGLAHPVVQGSR
jgi:endonuclease YncB( thermonuclease family)